jgi:hypothetical protein
MKLHYRIYRIPNWFHSCIDWIESTPSPISSVSILILPSHVRRHLESVSFIQVSKPKVCIYMSLPFHACATCSTHLTLLHLIIVTVFGGGYKLCCNSSILLLLSPSFSQIRSSAPFSKTLSIYIFFPQSDTGKILLL